VRANSIFSILAVVIGASWIAGKLNLRVPGLTR
jgi:hypothetical protein